MNQISDILSTKADELFIDDQFITTNTQPTVDEVIKDETPQELSIGPMLESNSEKQTIDSTTLKTMIHSMKGQLDSMLRMLNGHTSIVLSSTHSTALEPSESTTLETGEKVLEGVFDGEKMIGADGKEYSIPPNYASKSKLVEGDIMKLTITHRGSFIYKQISPVERERIVGELVGSEANQWSVLVKGKTYKILHASVTFYKGNAGDEVVILVPKDGVGSWGAVENILHK